MRSRGTRIPLAVVVLVGLAAAPVRGECDRCEACGLQRFFQQRLTALRCTCEAASVESRITCEQKSGCEQKAAGIPKAGPIRNVAVLQRTPLVLKPASVHGCFASQKSDRVQKGSAQKGLRLAGFVERLDTALLRVFPAPDGCCPRIRQQDSCGCGTEPAGYVPLLPVPEPWSSPHSDDNPFRDDTLPLPPPSPPAREARLPLHPPANRIPVVEDSSYEVRPVVFYAKPVSIEAERQ